MGLLNNWFKKDDESAHTNATEAAVDTDIGDVHVTHREDIFKAFIPEYLYKPPYGFPRPLNISLVRQLAANPYIYSIIKALGDEAASTKWDIVYKEDVEPTPALDEIQKSITKFFKNPNGNRESFGHLLRQAIRDLVELDSAVWVKVFNQKGEFSQMFARDGGYFLKNPNIYGYMGERLDLVPPINVNYQMANQNPNYAEDLAKYNSYNFRDRAAYFQYGASPAAMPIPFGKREIVYMMQNPRTNSIYGVSPIQILGDTLMTLVYGINYNLDFYMNNNMPEGVLELLGADAKQIKATRERMSNVVRVEDKLTGFLRKAFFRVPIVNTPSKFTPFQLTPQTMQVLEQQQWFTKVVWAAFGITPDEMGFTENSNKATGENQMDVYKRKAVRPLLQTIKYSLDNEIIPEWGDLAYESFEFQWVEWDIKEEQAKALLYQTHIAMGVKTPEMVAEDLNIDFTEVEKTREKQMAHEVNQAQSMSMASGKDDKDNKDNKQNNFKSILNLDTSFVPYASLKAELEAELEADKLIDSPETVVENKVEEPSEEDLIRAEFHNTPLEETLLRTIEQKKDMIEEAVANIGMTPLDKL